MTTETPEASSEAPETAPAPSPVDDALVVELPELAPPDEEGRLAFVLDWGGQIAWLHEAEAPAPDAGRRATLRDLAIAGVVPPAA